MFNKSMGSFMVFNDVDHLDRCVEVDDALICDGAVSIIFLVVVVIVSDCCFLS